MATRRRTSAVKSTTVKKSPRTVVKKSTVTPQSVNKVTQIEAVKVTETPVKNEVSKVKRNLTQLAKILLGQLKISRMYHLIY